MGNRMRTRAREEVMQEVYFIGPIFSEGTPIRNWTVQTAPSDANNNGVTGDKLDNLNVPP
jgi:hypothetical protein